MAIHKQKLPATSELLQGVLRVHKKIAQESGGQIFEDSAEDIRQMRQERSQYSTPLRSS